MIKCYENWSQFDDYQSHISQSEPFMVRKALIKEESTKYTTHFLEILSQCSQRVDVSYTTNLSHNYHGDPLKRESLEVKLSDFANAFQACAVGNKHWLLELGMYFFLSQCSIYSRESQVQQICDVDMVSSIPQFMRILPDLETINLWINLHEASSTLHYDANHNFLLVVKGCKRVKLISPTLTEQLHPFSAFCEAPNHSCFEVAEVDAFVASNAVAFPGDIFEIEICEGDLLFIPEGWWHQVSSVPLTVAINSWFTSGWSKLLANSPNMISYYARAIVNELVNIHGKLSTHTSQNLTKEFHINKKARSDSGNMTFDEFSSILDQITSGDNSSPFDGGCMILPSISSMDTLWIPYALQKPNSMETMLNMLMPEQASLFLRNWDELEKKHDGVGKQFRLLFDALPSGSKVMNDLLVKNNLWIETTFAKKLNRILGSVHE